MSCDRNTVISLANKSEIGKSVGFPVTFGKCDLYANQGAAHGRGGTELHSAHSAM